MLLVAEAVLSLVPDDATGHRRADHGGRPGGLRDRRRWPPTRGRALKAFSVRKEAKDHGGGGRIAGALDPGDRVVVTEDTVTRGTSLLEAARAVREAGAEPVLLVAVVDRGGTVAAMAAAEGWPSGPSSAPPTSGSPTRAPDAHRPAGRGQPPAARAAGLMSGGSSHGERRALVDEQAIAEAAFGYCRVIDRPDVDLVRSCEHPGALDHQPEVAGERRASVA